MLRRAVIAEPATIDELLERARAMRGLTLGELAASEGAEAPADLRRAKGWVGALIERVLGAQAGSAPTADLPALGVEIKSIPVRANGQPLESTFVCSVSHATIDASTWAHSRLRAKLSCVLWVPVHAERSIAPAERRVGTPMLWKPSVDEEALLRDDWEYFAGRLGLGRAAEITAHEGEVLQLRPKAATGRTRTKVFDAEGEWAETLPLGFYLRARFTAQILKRLLVG